MFRSLAYSRPGLQQLTALSGTWGLLPGATAAAAAASTHAPAAAAQQPAADSNSSSRFPWSTSWWTAAGAATMAAAAAVTATAAADAASSSAPTPQQAALLTEAEGTKTADGKLLSLPLRQRIFFKYEKRIRDLSSLEKIYEYFATHENSNKVRVMSSQDVVRALVPTYPPVGSNMERAGFLDGERAHPLDVHAARNQLLHFFDHDKDGTIGFNEFVLIVICMAVPEKDVDVVFDVMDLDNNGVIDEQEFKQVLEQLERRAGIQQGFHNRAGKHPIVDMDDKEMTHKLFQEQGGGVSLSRFRSFLQRLQEGMLRLEFAHYDVKGKGTISGADFANSLVTAANMSLVEGYLNKVDSMSPQLANATISLQDFKTVAFLRRNLHRLSFALDFCSQIERPLPREEFQKLLQKTLGVKLPPAVLDIIMYMFADSQGNLDGPGFVDVMKRRNKVPGYKRGQGVGVELELEAGSTPLVSWFNCVKDCTFGGGDTAAGQLR